jgi:hypothetical protein
VNAHLDQLTINAAFAQPNHDGSFPEEFAAFLRKVSADDPCVLLAFPPKCGGTFLRTAAIYALDGQLLRPVHAGGGRDAQLYLPIFLAYYTGDFGNAPMVAHVHMQALPANRHFIDALNLKPAMMMRSIPDILVSYADMLDRDPQARMEGLNCTIPPDWLAFDSARKAEFMTAFIAPWLAGYFATWADYAKAQPERVCVLTYGAFKADAADTLAKLLNHAGVPRPSVLCRAAVDKTWRERETVRFNRGEEGRGKGFLSAEQMARIARMLDNYPVLDEWRAEILPPRA